MRFIIYIFLVLSFFCSPAQALKTEKKNNAIYVKSATTAEIENLFTKYNFKEFNQSYSKFPRIYIEHLPTDWNTIPDSEDKNRTFIRMLIPLVLKINEEILAERSELEKIQTKFLNNEKLSKADLQKLEEKAQKYDVFTRLRGDEHTAMVIKQLMKKVDVLPMSVMVVSAAIYTDWGKSKLAQKYNSLYLEEIWYENKGVKPENDPNADYNYKTFNLLEDSIRSKCLKINSNISYQVLRESRKLARERNYPPYGPQLAAEMLFDSNLKNIAGLIDYTFSFYGLGKADYMVSLEDIK